MSYAKAVRHTIRKARKQANNHFGFSTLGQAERRRNPWLGSSWFQPGMEKERNAFIAQWHADTETMLKANPALKIVD